MLQKVIRLRTVTVSEEERHRDRGKRWLNEEQWKGEKRKGKKQDYALNKWHKEERWTNRRMELYLVSFLPSFLYPFCLILSLSPLCHYFLPGAKSIMPKKASTVLELFLPYKGFDIPQTSSFFSSGFFYSVVKKRKKCNSLSLRIYSKSYSVRFVTLALILRL